LSRSSRASLLIARGDDRDDGVPSSLEKIPLATAYAVWTGLSAVGSLLDEMAGGRQTGEPLRIVCILFILAATTGLQLAGAPRGR